MQEASTTTLPTDTENPKIMHQYAAVPSRCFFKLDNEIVFEWTHFESSSTAMKTHMGARTLEELTTRLTSLSLPSNMRLASIRKLASSQMNRFGLMVSGQAMQPAEASRPYFPSVDKDILQFTVFGHHASRDMSYDPSGNSQRTFIHLGPVSTAKQVTDACLRLGALVEELRKYDTVSDDEINIVYKYFTSTRV
jgi:hypothetical protein